MKIHCSKEDLARGVQTIQAALSARTTLPILLNFLVETEKSKVRFTSTDLEMGVKHYVGAEVEKDGSVTIPARKFSDIIHSLPDDHDIDISVDANGRVSLKSGRSRFGITGAPKSEYPLVPEFDKQNAFEVSAGAIADMVKKTIFSASSDETRHVLNGVFWTASKGYLETAATDGRRLSVVRRKILPTAQAFQAIVPTKVLSELLRLLGFYDITAASEEKMTLGVNENQITFQFKDTTLLSRLMGGNFPHYEQVIPAKKDITVLMDVKDLLAVTRRASLCSTDRGGSVRYTLKKGGLMVTASSQNLEFADEIPLEYNGEEFQTAFNPQFVIDMLKHIDSAKVKVSLTTPANPALFEPEQGDEERYVIMPMRA